MSPTPLSSSFLHTQSDDLGGCPCRDTGRVNIELETPQRPRLSVKVGYYFNGIERPNMGNTCPHTTLASALIFLPEAAS